MWCIMWIPVTAVACCWEPPSGQEGLDTCSLWELSQLKRVVLLKYVLLLALVSSSDYPGGIKTLPPIPKGDDSKEPSQPQSSPQVGRGPISYFIPFLPEVLILRELDTLLHVNFQSRIWYLGNPTYKIHALNFMYLLK